MKAVIMAGGEGTRLRPLTCGIPKPMMSVLGKPMMEHIIELLKENGITKAAATLMYLPNEIKEYFGDGSEIGMPLTYFEEETPRGTAGSVKNCSDFLKDQDDFIVISGDTACRFDLRKAIAFHKSNRCDATIILTESENPLEYGVVMTDKDMKITRFIEKPPFSMAYSKLINTGVYILNRSVLSLIPDDKPFDFGADLFPLMLKKGMALYGYEERGYWCDIGSISSYLECNKDALSGKYKVKGVPLQKIPENVTVTPPCHISEGAILEEGCFVGPYAIINEGCRISKGASVKNSLLLPNVYVGNMCEIRGAVICKNTDIQNGTRVFEGSAIGEGCHIGKHTLITGGACVWPDKTVDEGMNINQNVVSNLPKISLFDEYGLSGDIISEITPEICLRLGHVLAKQSDMRPIVISGSGSDVSELLTRALSLGICAEGGKVLLMPPLPECIQRFAITEYNCVLGVYVSEKNGQGEIIISSESGLSLSRKQERTLEKSFKEGMQRINIHNISLPQSLSGAEILYKKKIVKTAGDLSGVCAVIHCSDTLLCKSITEAICESGGKIEAGPSFFISPDGMSFSASDEKGGFYGAERAQVLTFLCRCLLGEKEIYIPYDFPLAAESVAQNFDVKIIRITPEDSEYDKIKTALFSDGCISVAYVLRCMKETGKPLCELSLKLPAFNIKTEKTLSGASKVFVMGKLSTTASDGGLKKGIRINFPLGNVLITPMKKKNMFVIKAEAISSEVADELCGDISDYIKNLNEKT